MIGTEEVSTAGLCHHSGADPTHDLIPFEQFAQGATVVSTPIGDTQKALGSARFSATLNPSTQAVEMPGSQQYQPPAFPVALVAQSLSESGAPTPRSPSRLAESARVFPILGAQLWCNEFTAQIVGVTPSELLCRRADGYTVEIDRQTGASFAQMFRDKETGRWWRWHLCTAEPIRFPPPRVGVRSFSTSGAPSSLV